MITPGIDLLDEEGVVAIREFVRNTPDIEVFQYVKRGANGEVYFGRYKKFGDDVVLKFYWSHPNYDETEEAVILRKIKHENILKIDELKFLPPNYAYFLTPKISGGDLQEIIDKQPISSKIALELICGILKELTELHSAHQIVHRDLKPGNILIDLDGYIPIIADLGAVKKIDSTIGYVSASRSTYLYLPPEAIHRNEYCFQSDIYQVGIILFQLLGGFFPINTPNDWLTKNEQSRLDKITGSEAKGEAYKKIFNDKIIRGKLIDTKTLPEHLDPSFKKVLNIALNLKHNSRFKNPSLFLKDIHHLLRTTPEYLKDGDVLSITHENGKHFRVYMDKKEHYVLEKSLSNNNWRKDNSHNGNLESILKIARNK